MLRIAYCGLLQNIVIPVSDYFRFGACNLASC